MDYILIKNQDDIRQKLSIIKQSKIIAIDTETTGLNPHADRIRLIQIAIEGYPVFILDCFSFLPEGIDLLKDILEDTNIKIFQNAKFDLQFFIALNIHPRPIFDTMLAGQLLRTSGGSSRVNLAALAKHYMDEEIAKEEQTSNWQGELNESQLLYAARDAEVLIRLRNVLVKQLYDNGLNTIARIEFLCVHAIAQMEYTGISLDMERWKKLIVQTEKEQENAQTILYEYAGKPLVQRSLFGEDIVLNHNFDSNQYILRLLHENGIETNATSKRVLSVYSDHPLIKALTSYRKATKALSSFLYPIPHMIYQKTNRLHPHYGQIGAWSGRMCCGGPNIQQIPRDLNFRACFMAPPGKKLIIADYSQIELRVAAKFSGDKRMIAAYKNGEDLHSLTASLVSDIPVDSVTKELRQAAKAVNFGLIFGMGAAGLQEYAQQSYGVEMTLEQATNFRSNFFKAYPGIAEWHRYIKKNKPVEERTLSGRKFIFDENSGMSGRYNTPVQGTAADIVKAALGTLVIKIRGTNIKIIAAVHDEILLESNEEETTSAATILKDAMELSGNAILMTVPCVVDVKISDSWAEK